MGLYVNGQQTHENSIFTFSAENGENLGDVINSHGGWEFILGGTEELHGLAIGLGKKDYSLSQVGGLVYNAEEPHHEYFHKKNLVCNAIVISETFLEDLLGDAIDVRSIHFSPKIQFDSPLLENARQTYLSLRSGYLDHRQIEAMTESLVLDVLEKAHHSEKSSMKKLKPEPSRLLMTEILVEIHRHVFEEDFDLTNLSQDLGVTKFHIIRTMKAAFGCTPYSYVRQLRLLRAAILLRNTKSPITQIAHECGFSELSAFNKAFKMWMKKSPRDFRKQ